MVASPSNAWKKEIQDQVKTWLPIGICAKSCLWPLPLQSSTDRTARIGLLTSMRTLRRSPQSNMSILHQRTAQIINPLPYTQVRCSWPYGKRTNLASFSPYYWQKGNTGSSLIRCIVHFSDGYQRIYDFKRFGHVDGFARRQDSLFNTVDILGFATLAGFGFVSCMDNCWNYV